MSAACLDTAHLFAAGYDIKSENGLASTLELIDRAIGLERIPVFPSTTQKFPSAAAWIATNTSARAKSAQTLFAAS